MRAESKRTRALRVLRQVLTFRFKDAERSIRREYEHFSPSLRLLIPWTLVRILTTVLVYRYVADEIGVEAGYGWLLLVVVFFGVLNVASPIVAWAVQENSKRRAAQERARRQTARGTARRKVQETA